MTTKNVYKNVAQVLLISSVIICPQNICLSLERKPEVAGTTVITIIYKHVNTTSELRHW